MIGKYLTKCVLLHSTALKVKQKPTAKIANEKTCSKKMEKSKSGEKEDIFTIIFA